MSLRTWLQDWRQRRAAEDELLALGADQREWLAHDIGVAPGTLQRLVQTGDAGRRRLERLMRLLGLNPVAVGHRSPEVMRDLHVVCAGCDSVGRCERDLAKGRARLTYGQYCPNAAVLDGLQSEMAGTRPAA